MPFTTVVSGSKRSPRKQGIFRGKEKNCFMVCSMFRHGTERIETGVFLFQYPLEPLKTSIVRAEVPTLSYWNGLNPIVKTEMALFEDTGQNTIQEPFGMVSLEIIRNTYHQMS